MVLQTRPAVTSPILADAIKQYTLKYLLAKNLLMVSFYHKNRVSRCLAVLDAFSPQSIVSQAAERALELKPVISDRFMKAMDAEKKSCLGHELHPELSELKRNVISLH